jgi:hypothetical protein
MSKRLTVTRRARWMLAGVAVATLGGCADQHDTAPEQVGEASEAIYYGTSSGVNFGVVQIYWSGNSSKPCTGYFITRRHIMTSAHCTDRNYVSQFYNVYVKTGYNTFTNLKDTARSDNWVLMKQTIYPGWDWANQQARYDTAILTLPATATSGVPSAQNMLGVATATPVVGQTYNIWGWGAYAIGPQGLLLPYDLLFGDNVTVSSVSSGSFIATSTGNRLTCLGDSGGPSTGYYSPGGYYISSGTHRGGEDPRCASPGEQMWWSDTRSKISWIETALRATYGSTFSCARVSSGVNAHMKCF